MIFKKYCLYTSMNEYEWHSYRIRKPKIGSGSFSKIYYGIHSITKLEIALKKIAFNSLHASVKEKVVSEIHILRQLNHKHIIRLYDYKFEGDYLYLITEFCKDGDLSQWMKHEHSKDEVLQVIQDIVKGMNYLHEQKIFHRDIKPQNILLHGSVVKLCDFGFSKIMRESHEMTQTLCGTPLYMSPELLFLKPDSFQSDIWALGIIFYMMVFGEHPFGALSSMSEYRSKIVHDISFPECDVEFQFIQSMLEFEPDKRPTMTHLYQQWFETEKTAEQRVIELEEKILMLESKQLKQENEIVPDYFPIPRSEPIAIPKRYVKRPTESSPSSPAFSWFQYLIRSFSK